jgi:hypothetical protein
MLQLGSLLLLAVGPACAQIPAGAAAVGGVVTDPSNALIPNASVTLRCPAPAQDVTVSSTRSGRYNFTVKPQTGCVVLVTASGFAPFESEPLRLMPDRALTLDVRLRIEDRAEVNVNDDGGASTDPGRNGDSLVLRGKAIDDLPLNSTELLQELDGLAGGATPDMYVDGFSNGTLPPRDSIREIRINQNPYSAQNDTNPGNGQIQVFTKPGANKLHGDFYAIGNDSGLNTQNRFVGSQPAYYNYFLNGNLNGPITKHSSFFVGLNRDDAQTNSVIDAQTLDPTYTTLLQVTQGVRSPNTGYYFSARVDVAPAKNSTVTMRYSLSPGDQRNGGVGGLNLLTQAFDSHTEIQTLQLSNSQILSAKFVNDTRFQYVRSRVRQSPASSDATVNVEGAFVGGGSNAGAYNDNQDRYELQNYVSASAGKEFFTFGGRFRATRDANHSSANYNGTYTFACLTLTSTCTANSYQATLRNGPGGGPSQYSVTQGNPNVAVEVNDTALFVQDDWKARNNLTLSGGLRFETQNVIADKADWAPRFGLVWGLKTRNGKPALYTLRAGAGIFYSRFGSGYVLQAMRQNGITQRQYLLTNPGCYPCGAADLAGAESQSTVYQIGPSYHAPYYISTTVSLERQIDTWGSVTVTYLGNRGVHQQVTRNVNAPLPGTYNAAIPTGGVRPLGGNENIYQYDSSGVYHTDRLNTNFFLHFKSNRIILYGYYQLRHETTDASGGGFPSNQYNLAVDEGRSPSDIRHSFYAGTGLQLPFNFHSYIFARAQSGNPFNITVGQDLNGDSVFTDRPTFATDLTRASVVKTAYGNFDTSPIPGQTTIPINYGHGPGLFLVNVQLSREFHFGPEVKRAANAPAPKLAAGQKPSINRIFSLELGADAQNLFNQVNLAAPIGTLNSPLFGRSIALVNAGSNSSANRIVNLEAFFRF